MLPSLNEYLPAHLDNVPTPDTGDRSLEYHQNSLIPHHVHDFHSLSLCLHRTVKSKGELQLFFNVYNVGFEGLSIY
jgi:hypothetical protein